MGKSSMQLYWKKGVDINLITDDEIKSYLAAVVKLCGNLIISNKRVSLDIVLSDLKYAIDISELIKKLIECELYVKNVYVDKINKLKGYAIELQHPNSLKLLDILSIIKEDMGSIIDISLSLPPILNNIKLISYYMQGMLDCKAKLFIPDASDSDNTSTGYRLDISPVEESYALDVVKLLYSHNINLKYALRRDIGTLYSADSSTISDLYAFSNLSEVVIKINDTLVIRSVKNQIVRTMNRDNANMDRALNAGEKLAIAVKILKNHNQYDKLDKSIRETVECKLSDLSLTLEQIGERINATKSCVNHRIRKIIKLAESLSKI